jgi:predicted phosphodiesterase
VSRLLVFGDLHCDRRHLRGLVERAVAEHCDALVSLGDLNYLPREPEGRRFLRSAGALLRRAGLELLLVEGNHDDAEELAGADARTRAPGPVRLGFSLHHLPAGTRFRLGRLRCLAYGGSPIAHAGRGWFRRLRSSGPPLSASPAAARSTFFFATTHARSRKARMLAARSRRSPRNSAPRSSSTATSTART